MLFPDEPVAMIALLILGAIIALVFYRVGVENERNRQRTKELGKSIGSPPFSPERRDWEDRHFS